MSKISGPNRLINLSQMIQRRACQRGPGGGARILKTDNLTRIGFVELSAGQKLPQISRLFIQYVLDPVSVFKSNPDMRPTEINLGIEEQIFYLIAHRTIINALHNIVEIEARQDSKLDTGLRINAVKAYLNTHPLTKMPWDEPIWTEMLESAALTLARRTVGKTPSINIRNLVNIGFMSHRAAPTLYRRATRRLVHFVIDPADALWNNPYQQPFRIKLSADELRVYVQIHKMVIELLKPVVVDLEAGVTGPLSTQARTDMVHRILQQI